jgi:hypothetical protein
MGFFSSLFGGSNPTLNQNIPAFQSQAGFSAGVGNKDVTAASKWYNDILSGDPTKMAEAIAPETSAVQGETQQAKNQTAQFSPRSGGTAATIAGLDANTRAQIIKLLGGLQSHAASGDASLGTTEQGIGLESRKAADDASQQQMQNWANSILGKSITEGVQAAETAGLGAAGGALPGGPGAAAGAQGALSDFL